VNRGGTMDGGAHDSRVVLDLDARVVRVHLDVGVEEGDLVDGHLQVSAGRVATAWVRGRVGSLRVRSDDRRGGARAV